MPSLSQLSRSRRHGERARGSSRTSNPNPNPSPNPNSNPSPNPNPNLVLVIVCAGVVLASLDLFIVNVALPQMSRSFGSTGLDSLSWVLNGYAIVYASLLVLFGRLADRFSRKRGFLLGVAVFVAASAACAAATSLPMLVGFRVLQAAGAALLTPTSLGLILATFPAERRQSAVRTWTAVGGLAAALGPAVGGLLVAASWRWVFLVNLPIGVAALIAGWRLLPEVPGHPIPWPDGLSAVLITAGVGALTLGLVEGGSWGWGRPADDRHARARRRPTRPVRGSHRPPRQSADRPGAVPRTAVHRVPPRWPCCSRSRSARCCCRGSCGHRTCGTGRR